MRRPVPVILIAVVIGLTVDLLMGADPPGYAAALGLGGCIVIIVASKWLGKVWLQRPQDYYERQPDA